MIREAIMCATVTRCDTFDGGVKGVLVALAGLFR